METTSTLHSPTQAPPTHHNPTRDLLVNAWSHIKAPIYYLILLFWAFVCLAPLYFTLVYALKPVANSYAPPIWWPTPFTLSNFKTVITSFNLFPRWILNSTILSVSTTVLRVLFCAMAGYAFARIEFPFKSILFVAVLVAMMMPGVILLIPQFLIIGPGLIRGGINIGSINLPTGFHLLDNLGGYVLPNFVYAFGVFMMTQYYKSIPKELEEAAVLDGASRWGIFFRIILPISQTQLLTLGLLAFQGVWNDFMLPLIILRSPQNFTLPLGLQWFKGEYYSLYSNVLAGSLFNTLPILILFFAFQRYFVQSIATTGSKEG